MVGIFDSGIGGLTIVKAIQKRMPNLRIIYFGDTARTPYGNKSRETIEKYAREDMEFLRARGASVIVAACHSASALAHGVLHQGAGAEGGIAGMPTFDVIDASVRAALAATKNGRIGVIGTRATINSGVYQELLPKKGATQVFVKACPLFVPLVEENWIKRQETKMIVRAYLQELKLKKIDTLVMACTHYPFLRGIIQARMGRRVMLIDPGEEVARDLENFLRRQMPTELSEANGAGVGGRSAAQNLELHFSDTNTRQEELIQNWLNIDKNKI